MGHQILQAGAINAPRGRDETSAAAGKILAALIGTAQALDAPGGGSESFGQGGFELPSFPQEAPIGGGDAVKPHVEEHFDENRTARPQGGVQAAHLALEFFAALEVLEHAREDHKIGSVEVVLGE